MSEALARRGWDSSFPEFRDAKPKVIQTSLRDLLREVSQGQDRAWRDSIPSLQAEVGEVCDRDGRAGEYTAILEYELPLESRRPDVILLYRDVVVVLELKGKRMAGPADRDQVAAYARDLRCYHRSCADRVVHAVVVPTRAVGYLGIEDGVHIVGPDAIDSLLEGLAGTASFVSLPASEFLSESAYRPLPTLVKAARELFHSGTLRDVWRARAATDPAVEEICRIIHEAAATKTKRLILLNGVPGAGKTLVGLRVVHAHFLDDLAVPRSDGKPVSPAVFLSGNGPLVQVLQYELGLAGGAGKAFVRRVRDFIEAYALRAKRIPPEHVLVFDEAQRAWDQKMMANEHEGEGIKSEPEHFIEIADRIPEWGVVIGLIGTGQEIHVGEEAGLMQWARAVEATQGQSRWQVHGSPQVLSAFEGVSIQKVGSTSLSLDTELRYHLARDVHQFVEQLLAQGVGSADAQKIGERLSVEGYNLRITRDLEKAKNYLRSRYEEDPDARFGLLASAKDKDLAALSVPNDFQSTKRLRVGPWYGDGAASEKSCRQLRDVATEFQAQGLELDAVLLAWGTDLIREGGAWSNSRARGYRAKAQVKNPLQLRINAYRVLLTRGRDGTVVFVPPLPILDETFAYLKASGFKELGDDPEETVERKQE